MYGIRDSRRISVREDSSAMFGGEEKRTDAREGVIRERVDEEKMESYSRIIDLLLAGGYFRARISGLSPFDKVVGGMAWSISASMVDVDVDVFFQENSSIGQRIKLSEKLIEALHKMKCPIPLQAQQIQGLDFISLFPVMQWLIKKVIETREETGDLVRKFSESQFGKNFEMPQDTDFTNRLKPAAEYTGVLGSRYRPQRRYKRQKTSTPTVQQTLLEYDKLNRMSRAQEKKEKTGAAKKVEDALGAGNQQDEAEAEEQRIKEMLDELDIVKEDNKVSINLSEEQLKQIAAQRDLQHGGDAAASGAGQKIMKEKQHKQKIALITRQIEQQKAAYLQIKEEYTTQHEKAEELQDLVSAKEKFNERILAETAKLDALETPENAAQLQTLRNLIGLNESLRTQEAQFKASCKKQLTKMKELIAELQKDIPDSEDAEKRKLIEETFTADSEKLKKIKQLLSKKMRDIALVERKIDEVPSRTELLQYQRQFVDLYEQVSSRLTETRQYYTTYNTLEDTRAVVLSRELSILNSINDNYKVAMSTKSHRDKYLESFEAIVKGVISTLEKEEAKCAKEKKTGDELNQRYLKLVEKERLFYKATKEFQDECKKNERLLAQIEQ